jgi:AcrR family transcriptional regulator
VKAMPRSKEQFEDMRQKSKSTIIETALRLFATKGYHSTSISAIAKEAGIAVGLMYNYFSSKEELLVSIIDDNFRQLIESVSHETGEINETTDIHILIDSMMSAIINSNFSWKLIISIMFQPDISENAQKYINGFFLHQVNLYESYFRKKGIKNPQESAKALAAVVHGAFLNYACSDNAEEFKFIRDTVIDKLLTNGLQ